MTVNTWITGTNGGRLRVQANGLAEFDPFGAFDSLALGATATTEFTITIEDDAAAQQSAILTVTFSRPLININVESGNEVELSVAGSMLDGTRVTVVAAEGSVGEGTYTFTAAQIRNPAPLYFPGTAAITLVEV